MNVSAAIVWMVYWEMYTSRNVVLNIVVCHLSTTHASVSTVCKYTSWAITIENDPSACTAYDALRELAA